VLLAGGRRKGYIICVGATMIRMNPNEAIIDKPEKLLAK
jgi:hypothetical protein